MRGRLRTIDHDDRADRVGQAGHLGDRCDRAEDIRHVGDCDDLGARRQEGAVCVQVHKAVGIYRRDNY